MQHTIDATNKKIGRVASDAARLIMGKNLTSFKRNELSGVKVVIENASRADITEKKRVQKIYSRYTGYPGGLRKESASQLSARKGTRELFRKAVYGMLPVNKLRSKMMKQLIIKE